MKLLKIFIGCFVFAVVIYSCKKKENKLPPTLPIWFHVDSTRLPGAVWDTIIPVNASLKSITQSCLALDKQVGYRKLGDTTIMAVVVGDDKGGNIYKSLFIEDTLGGGIELYIDKASLYSDYPVGRKVYIKLNGLYLVNYKGLPEICYNATSSGSSVTTSAIPAALINSYIVKGRLDDSSVKPREVTIEELTTNHNNYICGLVTIKDAQFESTSAGKSYAEYQVTTNRVVENCSHASIILRSSGYADFQPEITPTGRGSITAIITAYLTTPQLLLRNTNDVNFTALRCP